MTTQLSSDCQSAECQATFTINGKRGDQKFSYGCMVTLQADENEADTYRWELVSSPPHCGDVLLGVTQAQARLALPIPGAYIPRLTITKGDCTAQAQCIILVGVSDCLPYPHPGPCPCPCLSEEDIAAIEDAAGIPNSENPFVTQEQLDNYLSKEDKAAIENAAGVPDSQNPFVTTEQLNNYLSEDDRAAIEQATIKPDGDNPFITQEHLDDYLSQDDKAAIEEATIKPYADNPFVTQKHLDELRQEHFLSTDDINAIQLAQGFPNANNPFITQQQLDQFLSEEKKEAIEYSIEAANRQNPFVARSEIITGSKKDAIDHATAEASAENPFVARSEIITGPKKAAVDNALDTAGSNNPFVTQSEIITGPKKKAIDHANHTANEENPFITHDEVDAKLEEMGQPAEQPVRVVAAGVLDLAQTPPLKSPGGLIELVESEPDRGLATLIFEGYDYDRCQTDTYVIKALPVNKQVGQPAQANQQEAFPRPVIMVQFVRFSPEGFQLHMVDLAHLPTGRPKLGPCMIEVSEINAPQKEG